MKPRNTKTKDLVTKIFATSHKPLQIQEVHAQVQRRYPKTVYSTVYRIVQALLKNELLLVVDWKERGSRYEWTGKTHHHHLLCNSCGDVTDIDDSLLNFNPSTVTQKTGFLVKEHSIELFGLCQPCQGKSP